MIGIYACMCCINGDRVLAHGMKENVTLAGKEVKLKVCRKRKGGNNLILPWEMETNYVLRDVERAVDFYCMYVSCFAAWLAYDRSVNLTRIIKKRSLKELQPIRSVKPKMKEEKVEMRQQKEEKERQRSPRCMTLT